ncbi:MAG: hypothetical protein NVSMB27_18000 [Ktedonobacteraceae bacterium]
MEYVMEKEEENKQMSTQHIWDLWIPDTAAQGISFARGRLDATEVLIVHAAPEKLTVAIYDDNGVLQAQGKDLPRTANTPMARLQRQGNEVTREDIWPTTNDQGLPVILAGGEVGILQQWWNDAEQQEWRWSLEFYNHR